MEYVIKMSVEWMTHHRFAEEDTDEHHGHEHNHGRVGRHGMLLVLAHVGTDGRLADHDVAWLE